MEDDLHQELIIEAERNFYRLIEENRKHTVDSIEFEI